ncbi:uncharacterized protein LOC132637234 [Lycium barbarum]|uniref:uncharacterized protein LOC132637234 n=1 Tax=Lycium barbarum TaxID=112863 RepID=UPI00293EBE84|nr:uncharacterized protein LOC132637234 [Lycium barbarum]
MVKEMVSSNLREGLSKVTQSRLVSSLLLLKCYQGCSISYEGGIGVRSLQEITESFSAKLWWTFRTAESLWTKFMKAKYSMRIHPMARKWNYTHSHTWRRLMKIRDKVDHLIHWKINKGNSNIWWDNWMGTGKLARLNTNTSINSPLHHYIHHKEWDMNKLLKVFPLEMVNNIQNIKIHSLDNSDLPIWTPTCDRKFTCKSAWNAMREANLTSLVNKKMWHKKCHSKSPFSSGDCSGTELLFGHQETQEHLFHDSMISKDIWKERCKSRFEDIKMSKARVISNTYQQMVLLVHKQFNTINPFMHWSNFMEITEQAKPLFKTTAVKWNFPGLGTLKLNSDGCSKGNLGPSGGESDSKLLVEWITGKSKPPWSLMDMVELIQHNLESIQDKTIHHIYRECNKLADSLANWGLSHRHTIWMNNFQELPRETRGELKVDKMQIPSFRNSIVKNSFYMYRSMYRNFLFDVP